MDVPAVRGDRGDQDTFAVIDGGPGNAAGPLSRVPAEEFAGLLTARDFPRPYAEFLSAAPTEVAAGRRRITVTETVERLIGRRPYGVADFARHHAATTAAR